MIRFGFLTLLLIHFSPNQVISDSEVYYITATSADLCTFQPCLTLSQFAAKSSQYLHPNTTLAFLPGTHHLGKVNLTLVKADYFVMKSENSTAQIKCTIANDSRYIIHFSQSRCIRITNLEFIGCGGNQVTHVQKFVIKDTTFSGQDNSGTALELTETTAQIINSTFISNSIGSHRKCPVVVPGRGCFSDGFIGGVIISTNSTINISHSRFEDNRADHGGAIYAEWNSVINVNDSIFINNNAKLYGGVIFSHIQSTVTISESLFQKNTADQGGVLSSSNYSNVTIEASDFYNNHAIFSGGVVYSSFLSTVMIAASNFHGNRADFNGGVLMSDHCFIEIARSEFDSNNAYYSGGVLFFSWSVITIQRSEFRNNTCYWGGVLAVHRSTIAIEASGFNNNNATGIGGVLTATYDNSITIGGSNFTKNYSPMGAVFHVAVKSVIQFYNTILIDSNMAESYAVIYLSDSELRGLNTGNVTFSSNLGSLLAFNSNVTFTGYATFVNNQPALSQITSQTDDFHEGGAITLFQSNITFDGTSNLEYNYAENGGAIHSTDSKFYINGNVTIAHNRAARNGGGVYLSTSEVNCRQESNIEVFNNYASHKGGGLHAVSSSVKTTSDERSSNSGFRYTGARLSFTKNVAKYGGGLSLGANARLYVLKYDEARNAYEHFQYGVNTTIFTDNRADYGGAVYVDDDSNSGTCASDPKTECFFQVLQIYSGSPAMNLLSLKFLDNHANISGSTLYGGLLDRCAVSPFAEFYKKHVPNDVGGIAYFRNVSVVTDTSISSRAVRVCLFTNYSMHDCTYQNHVDVKKGETFTVSLVAVDQVGQPVSATIQASLRFTESGLAEGQLNREIYAETTNVTFNIVSPHNSEILGLYASDGPCRNVELSRATVEIHFLPCSCPIGLQVTETNKANCTCECHSVISQYLEHCDSHSGSLVKRRQSTAWISYINNTNLTGYLVYPNCPLDYCLSTSPPINLNKSDGADAQCAFNRSSLLCGSCQPGLSLSLGSSRCLQCPSYWPALLVSITIAAILAGIALVTLLLMLNMTVAVGTLNGLIFYANIMIVHANKSILFPFRETNPTAVFLSWLNFELGIDTCYFPGMDTYIKTWLQLAFPAYVILLVALVIIVSSYSTRFSNLIGKKDPVATLATLILLSYAKLIEVCFKSLSIGILEYPDGSSEMQWLPDATVKYLSGKHIPLFVVAVLILLVGLVYTALLFSWQWLLHLPKWRIFRWSRNPRIQTFIETYHMPYTSNHRYWTGLLLIVRVVLYLIAATDVSNDPIIALLSITFVVGFIVFLKGFAISKQYRKWSTDALETFFHLNIFIFTIFTWYCFSEKCFHQDAIIYTSVILTIAALLLIIFYHVYAYTTILSKVKNTKRGRMIERLFVDNDPKPKPRPRRYSPPPDDDIHRFDELMEELDCPVNTDDYNTVPLLRQTPVEPTFSVVEVHPPRGLAVPDVAEANAQNN